MCGLGTSEISSIVRAMRWKYKVLRTTTEIARCKLKGNDKGWNSAKVKHESVESSREWILHEAEFQTISAKGIRGLESFDIRKNITSTKGTFVGTAESDRNKLTFQKRK